MYVEDQLWIAEKLDVQLSNDYLVATSNFPFLDHEGSDELLIWDNGETVIRTTEKLRQQKGWPHEWVCIGQKETLHYILDCNTEQILLIDPTTREIKYQWHSVQPIFNEIHDGYRGKLPADMPRKDSSFKRLNYYEDIPWDRGPDDPLPEDDMLLRVDKEGVEDLVKWLNDKKVHVLRINGSGLHSRDELFDAISKGITGIEGCVDEWPDVSRQLESILAPIAGGGLMDVVVIWEHTDETLTNIPSFMVEATLCLENQDHSWDIGCYVQTLYAGKKENGYWLKLK